jgi:hypothetical protein
MKQREEQKGSHAHRDGTGGPDNRAEAEEDKAARAARDDSPERSDQWREEQGFIP